VFDPGALIGGAVTGLREGVEAALVIAIIAGFLTKTGNGRFIPRVLAGAAAAIVVSIALGVAIYLFIGELATPWEQLLEATTMLVAAAIVTWMLFWMKRQAAGIRGDLQARVARVLDDGGVWGLTALAFTAVIREGVETAVFLVGQAAAATGSDGALSVVVGAVLGLALATGVGYLVYAGSRRVDLRLFFRVTGILLVFIAAGLVGRAVHELVEIGVLAVATAPVFDLAGVLPDDAGVGLFLRAIFGYSAAPEAIALLAWVTYVLVVLTLYLRPARPAGPAPDPTPEASTATAT
jgi:high-affinity iron transporter